MSEKKHTIDERLDRLVERHEALSQSVELPAGSTLDLRAMIEARIAREQERDLSLLLDALQHRANGDE